MGAAPAPPAGAVSGLRSVRGGRDEQQSRTLARRAGDSSVRILSEPSNQRIVARRHAEVDAVDAEAFAAATCQEKTWRGANPPGTAGAPTNHRGGIPRLPDQRAMRSVGRNRGRAGSVPHSIQRITDESTFPVSVSMPCCACSVAAGVSARPVSEGWREPMSHPGVS